MASDNNPDDTEADDYQARSLPRVSVKVKVRANPGAIGVQEKVAREIAVVLILNLVPYLGLGFLSASGRAGLPFMAVLWLYEFAFRQQNITFPVYIMLSMFGAAIVLVKNATAIERIAKTRQMRVHDFWYDKSPDPDSDRNSDAASSSSTSIRGDLMTENSEFSLSPFDEKVKRAERELLAQHLQKANAQDRSQDEQDLAQELLAQHINKANAQHLSDDEREVEREMLANHINKANSGSQEEQDLAPERLATQINRANAQHRSNDEREVERQMLADHINRANSGQPLPGTERDERNLLADQLRLGGISKEELLERQLLADQLNKSAKPHVVQSTDRTTGGAAQAPVSHAPAQESLPSFGAPAGSSTPPASSAAAPTSQLASPAAVSTPSASTPAAVTKGPDPITVLPPDAIATSPMLDARFAAKTAKVVDDISNVAFQTVQADSINEAARQADQLTAAFSSENATASAGLLDSTQHAATDKLFDGMSSPPAQTAVPSVESTASAADLKLAGHLDSLGTIPEIGSLPGLGSIPGFDNSNLGLGLGTIPGVTPPGASSGTPEAPAGSASGSASKSGVCPKCGADLHGQFSFCLSCLNIL